MKVPFSHRTYGTETIQMITTGPQLLESKMLLTIDFNEMSIFHFIEQTGLSVCASLKNFKRQFENNF